MSLIFFADVHLSVSQAEDESTQRKIQGWLSFPNEEFIPELEDPNSYEYQYYSTIVCDAVGTHVTPQEISREID